MYLLVMLLVNFILFNNVTWLKYLFKIANKYNQKGITCKTKKLKTRKKQWKRMK